MGKLLRITKTNSSLKSNRDMKNSMLVSNHSLKSTTNSTISSKSQNDLNQPLVPNATDHRHHDNNRNNSNINPNNYQTSNFGQQIQSDTNKYMYSGNVTNEYRTNDNDRQGKFKSMFYIEFSP